MTVLAIAERPPKGELGPGSKLIHHESLEDAKGTLLEGGFDCVVLDLMLPDSAGLEAVRGIRARAPQSPIVVLAGEEDQRIARRAVKEGADGHMLKGADELRAEIEGAIERKQAELAAARRATRDELTGLPNRALFLERLELTLGRLQRRSRAAAVLFLDLNDFKAVNERLGYDLGDELLVAVGERLGELVRPGDTIARFGGDEFMLICDDVSDEDDAICVADRVGAELSLPFDLGQNDAAVAVSIGIAVADGLGREPQQLMRVAREAMLAAKSRGARWHLADGAPLTAA